MKPPPRLDDGAFVTIERQQWEQNWDGGVGERQLSLRKLATHNVASKTTEHWQQHAQRFPWYEFRTRVLGRLNPWMFSQQKRGRAGRLLQLAPNFMSLLLPRGATPWASMFVVEVRRR